MARNDHAREMALGGMMAALSIVIMCLGGMIPVATYVCPMLCMLLLQFVLKSCGARTAWAWYGAVALLSLLIGSDKEAASVFIFLGYYPILRPKLEKARLKWLWKGLLFNASILTMYWLLIHLMGLAAVGEEFREMGTIMLAVLLLMGNLTFFLLDRILGRGIRRGWR